MNTVVCVCTYRRPDGLRALLNSLTTLSGMDDVAIVVADNDANGAGKAVCDQLPADYPFAVHSLIETQTGISAARNAAVNKALSLNPEYLAFLDDDEKPSTDWLVELHRVQKMTQADVVGGPTLSEFPDGVSEEQKNNPYFGADLGTEDGEACQLQAAGNFMITAAAIKPMTPVVFHPAFAQSGGEDLAFFTQLAQRGATMHWAKNAIVHEAVPANRLTKSWMKSRVINIANSRVRVMQMLEPSIFKALIRGVKTVALGTVAGITTLLALVLPAKREQAQMLRWKFWGKLSAHLRITTVRGEGH